MSIVQPLFKPVLNSLANVLERIIKDREKGIRTPDSQQLVDMLNLSPLYQGDCVIMGDSERQYSLPSSEAHEKPKVGGVKRQISNMKRFYLTKIMH